jgi:hypothetical protein
VLPYLGLMKTIELVELVHLGDVVVNLDLKKIIDNSNLPKGDLESMHLVPKRVGGGYLNMKCSPFLVS